MSGGSELWEPGFKGGSVQPGAQFGIPGLMFGDEKPQAAEPRSCCFAFCQPKPAELSKSAAASSTHAAERKLRQKGSFQAQEDKRGNGEMLS